jgi:hypothetical protein
MWTAIPAQVVCPALAFARVHPGAEREAGRARGIEDGQPGPHSGGGGVERCDEPVAGGVHLVAIQAAELGPHDRIMGVELAAPRFVAQLGGADGRLDDVGEQHGSEDAVG